MASYNVTLNALRVTSSAAMKKAYAIRLREAAQLIADRAKKISSFSTRIPGTITVKGGVSGLYIEAGGTGGNAAPNAYPFETGAHHPLFGDKNHWYPQPKKPFLDEAAADTIEAAAVIFSQVFDDWAKELDLE